MIVLKILVYLMTISYFVGATIGSIATLKGMRKKKNGK